MLRPIDVIFKHPVKKFTVIYQNGTLWQLPKLVFDGQSLRYKKIYRGSREHIFVSANQSLDRNDTLLLSQLRTIDLPEAVIGRNVDEFEHWWQYNWHNFRDEIKLKQQIQQQAKQLIAQNLSNDQPQPKLNSHQISMPNISRIPTTNSHENQKPADIFDNMLDDLIKDL